MGRPAIEQLARPGMPSVDDRYEVLRELGTSDWNDAERAYRAGRDALPLRTRAFAAIENEVDVDA